MSKIYSKLNKDSDIESFLDALNIDAKKSLGPQIALFEFQSHLIGHAAYSFFIKYCLAEGIKPICFSMQNNLSLRTRISEKIRFKFKLDSSPTRPNYILSRLQLAHLVHVVRKQRNLKHVRKFVHTCIGKTKEEILRLEYQGILIGDLFYDWHLSKRGIPTIETSSSIFQEDLIDFLNRAHAWDQYFQAKQIRYVFLTHAVYVQGLILRIGLKHRAKVFLVNSEKVFQFSNERFLSDLEWQDYNKESEVRLGYTLNENRARKMLSELKSGSKTVDVAHSYVNGMSGHSYAPVISRSSKVKILIAAHCFSDSPHTNGLHLFPDFIEWLNWLGEFSKKSDHEWYIKEHPAFFPSDYDVLGAFCEKYPNIRLVNHSYSNSELIRQGINVVLTVYGTIAFEAASLGALVINASQYSPHVNFNFSISPSSISEYANTLNDLNSLLVKWKNSEADILHFYDIHHLRRNFSWIFHLDYSQITNEFGVDYSNPWSLLEFFKFRVSGQNLQSEIQNRVNDFIKSNSYSMNYPK